MRKIEKPEDVVVVSRRRWMQLSSLAAAGSVMLGGLELGAKEPQYSRERASADPHDSDAIFGSEEASATTGWEIYRSLAGAHHARRQAGRLPALQGTKRRVLKDSH